VLYYSYNSLYRGDPEQYSGEHGGVANIWEKISVA
jgi:hypothetical protein